MATIADYTVISDSTFELIAGQSKELNPFFPPEDLVPGQHKAKAILCYKARPLPHTAPQPHVDLKISLKLQNLHIETVSIADDIVRVMWEPFPADELSQAVKNVFIFRALEGRVQISDVILWYQRLI